MGGTQIQAHEAVSRCIAVLDVGTTAVKACLFSPSLELLACCVQEYALRTQGERVEADAAQYQAAARAGLADALSQAPGCIPAAVSITTQGETLTLADRSGEPLRPFLVWLDSRAENEAQALRSVLDNETFYKTTGLPEVTGALPLAKLLWLRKHEPDTFARAHKLLLLEDYLLHWLTGRFVSEKSLQTSTGWFDLHSDGLWHSGLAAAGASAELLPELLECGAPAGSLRNGPDRRRACRRLHAPGHRHRNHGYRAGNGRLHRRSHVSQRAPRNRLPPRIAGQVPVPAHRQHGGHGVALVPGRILPRPSRRSSGICSAGRAGAKRPLRVRRVGVPAVFIRQRGSRRLSRSPRRILRRAAFHFARSVMESVAFLLRDFFGMLNALGCPADTVYSLGGGARSAVWQQIKADACGRTFRVPACSEATAMGAALLAGWGSGLIAPGVFPCRGESAVYLPDNARAPAYDTAYSLYKKLYSAVKPLYNAF